MQKLTLEQVNDMVQKGYNKQVEVVAYFGKGKKMKLKCHKCGTLFETYYKTATLDNPYSVCPVCGREEKGVLKKLEYQSQLDAKYPGEYTILADSVMDPSHDKVLVRHNVCGYTWPVIVTHVLIYHSCPSCHSMIALTIDAIYDRVYKRSNGNLIVNKDVGITDTDGTRRVEVTCQKHNYTWRPSLANITGNRQKGCPMCKQDILGKAVVLTNDEFIKRASAKMKANHIMPITSYNRSDKPIKMLCLNCKSVYTTTPTQILAGHGCVVCHASLAERLTHKLFSLSGVNFEYQKPIDTKNEPRPLHLDFYLPDLNTVLELDGGFHDKKNNVKLARADYDNVLKWDTHKNNWCEDNGVTMVRLKMPKYPTLDYLLEQFSVCLPSLKLITKKEFVDSVYVPEDIKDTIEYFKTHKQKDAMRELGLSQYRVVNYCNELGYRDFLDFKNTFKVS